jgi:uncharacterized protein YkwD
MKLHPQHAPALSRSIGCAVGLACLSAAAVAAPEVVSAETLAHQRTANGQVLRLAIGAGVTERAAPQALASATCADNGTKVFRQEVLKLTNQYRATGRNCGSTWYPASKPLTWDTLLKRAAGRHSRDMAKNNFFSHTGSDGSSMGERISDAGYSWSAAGENIAAGYDTVASVMAGWINSPGHCANIMSARYKDIGVVCVPSTTADYDAYWTMDLAAPL